MAMMNPYDEDPQQVKRKVQINMLGGAGAPPTSNTMPIGGGRQAIAIGETDPTGGRGVTPPQPPPPVTGPPRAIGGAPPSGRARSGAAPGGFSQANWDDPNMQSVKYAAGSFLSGATRPSEVAQIVNSPEFQARFPGARFNGKDMIDFAGAMSDGSSGVPVGLVDVLRSADQGADSSEGFWWGANEAGGDFVPSDGDARGTFAGGEMGGGLGGDNSALAQIMKELAAMRDGQQSPSQRDAIMQILGGGA